MSLSISSASGDDTAGNLFGSPDAAFRTLHNSFDLLAERSIGGRAERDHQWAFAAPTIMTGGALVGGSGMVPVPAKDHHMINPSATQLALLSHAARQTDGNLWPLPDTITAPRLAIEKSIGVLLKRELIEETDVAKGSLAWRHVGDAHYGVRISDAGRQAIAHLPEVPPAGDPVPPMVKKQSKTAAVVALLQRDDGATMEELVAATGWLAHTTRAALTGLRKKGYALDKSKRSGATCYSIATKA